MTNVDVTVAKLEASAKSAHRRLDEMTVQMREFQAACLALERLDEKVDTLRHALEEIKADVKTMSEKPASRWDKLVSALIGAAVSIAVSAAAAAWI